MRTDLRVTLVGLSLTLFIFIALLSKHRDDWRDHLRTVTNRPFWQGNREPVHVHDGSVEHDSSNAPGEQDREGSAPGREGHPPNESPYKQPQKAVVMARLTTENTAWVEELDDWSWYVYTVDDTNAPLHTPRNKGRESLAYLTYLVDNYDNLAETIAFVHSHRDGYPGGWHTDAPAYSNVASLQLLQTSYIQEAGYANLRCNPSVGCSAELQMHREPRDETRTAEIAMAENWKTLVADETPLPDIIAAPCCAQFAVSAQQVRKRPLSDYQRYRQWVLDTPLPDDTSGRVMEYFWHIMFGQEPIFCPEMSTCYCNVYGRC